MIDVSGTFAILEKRGMKKKTDKPLDIGEYVETLAQLGLTERQAKVYLTLLRIGASKATAISKLSKVHRQEVYGIVTGLQEMGLVERQVTSPIMFNAIPIDDAIDVLIHKRSRAYDEVRLKARKLATQFRQIESQPKLHDTDSYFSIISGGDLIKKFREATNKTNQNVNLVTSWKRFRIGFSNLEDAIKKALQRGVVVQLITEKPKNETFPKWVAQELIKNPNFRLITVANYPSTMVVVYDNTEAALCINPTADIKGAHLWSNNSRMVALCQSHFNNMWINAEQVKSAKAA
jgi:sugar-specific transcriptional regulator TrmB